MTPIDWIPLATFLAFLWLVPAFTCRLALGLFLPEHRGLPRDDRRAIYRAMEQLMRTPRLLLMRTAIFVAVAVPLWSLGVFDTPLPPFGPAGGMFVFLSFFLIFGSLVDLAFFRVQRSAIAALIAERNHAHASEASAS